MGARDDGENVQWAGAWEGRSKGRSITETVERETVHAIVSGAEEDAGTTSAELGIRVAERAGRVCVVSPRKPQRNRRHILGQVL